MNTNQPRPLRFDWKRFWAPSGTDFKMDEGFLYKPDSEWGRYYNSECRHLSGLEGIQCLILLGESGSGKTDELENLERQIQNRHNEDIALRIELKNITSINDLISAFEIPEIEKWREGNSQLTLLLDSLDEGMLETKHLANRLVDTIKQLGKDRLAVRITCRIADWPSTTTQTLLDYFDKENVKQYEISPLRREDIELAAEQYGLSNVHGFIQSLSDSNVSPLAAQPLTLRMLLDIYDRDQSLPASRIDLYTKGLKFLCEEQSLIRRDWKQNGRLTGEQRFVVAAKLAALTAISNRSMIYDGSKPHEHSGEDLIASDLIGDGGTVQSGGSDTIWESVHETIKHTALFRGETASDGSRRFAWIQRGYEEFLAAWHLNHHVSSTIQLASLFVQRIRDSEKIVPQLRQVAAWLAAMHLDFREVVLGVEPEILLWGDSTAIDETFRRRIMPRLLTRAQDGSLNSDVDLDFPRLRSLQYVDIGVDLRPYIQDRTEAKRVRSIAIRIGMECREASITPALLKIALDASEAFELRTDALWGIRMVGTDQDRQQIKPLLQRLSPQGPEEDPDDKLRGYTLLTLWPEQLTAQELFSTLTPPKRGHFYGAYQSFLSDHITLHLQPGDLAIGLKWIRDTAAAQYRFESLANSLLFAALQHLDMSDIKDEFLNIITDRFNDSRELINGDNEGVFTELLESDDDKRRLILSHLLDTEYIPYKRQRMLPHTSPRLLLPKDTAWLIDQLRAAQSIETREILSYLISCTYDPNDAKAFALIYNEAQTQPILDEEIRPFLQIDLGSQAAKYARKDYTRMEAKKAEAANLSQLRSTTSSRVESWIQLVEQGDADEWRNIDQELRILEGLNGISENTLCLTKGFSWLLQPIITHNRLFTAARTYISFALRTYSGSEYDLKAYWEWVTARALYFLNEHAPILLNDLTHTEWRLAARLILGSDCDESQRERGRLSLAATAYRHMGNTFLDAAGQAIKTTDQNQVIQILGHLGTTWDAAIASQLRHLVHESIEDGVRSHLLRFLLQHDDPETTAYALDNFKEEWDRLGPNSAEVLSSAQTIVNNTKDASWTVVWPLIQSHPEFGKSLLMNVAYGSHSRRVTLWEQLTEDQLATLYLWLRNEFPMEEDPERNGIYEVTARDRITDLRRNTIQALSTAGTLESIDALRMVSARYPGDVTVEYYLFQGITAAHRAQWLPPTPAALIAITRDAKQRLVRNADELMDVVLESFQRLQEDILGELPGNEYLWDRVPLVRHVKSTEAGITSENKLRFRPKDEEALSTWIARHLRQDLHDRGIIIGREVQIRKLDRDGQGQRTDILVNAVTAEGERANYGSISIIIEVKGQWNTGLKKSMQSQLAERYLGYNQMTAHGIYLTGYYDCVLWDTDDSRRQAAKRNGGFEEIRDSLDQQAIALSVDGRRIKSFVLDVRLGKPEERDI